MYPPMDAPFDLGLGAPPTPPQLPAPSSANPSKSAKLMQLALMGLAGGLGPGAGTGILRGLHQTTQQRRQDALYQDRQNAQQYEQQQQTYEMQARQFQQQQALKQKAVADAFESLQKDAVNLPSRKALEERAGMYAQSLGYMGIRMSPQALIGQVRYLEPKERDVVAAAVNANQKQYPKAWENGAPLDSHIRYTDPTTGEPRDIQIRQAITAGLIDLPVDETGAWIGTKGVKPERETRSLQVQAADALAAGDTETYNRLLKVDKDFQVSGRVASAPRDGAVTPSQQFSMEERLAKSWVSANQSSREVQRQFSLMQTGLKRFRAGDKNGGSQAVLVTFQKILDPTSVVRESEYARTASGQSFLNRLAGYEQKLAQGGAGMTDGELAAMVETARQFMSDMQTFTGGARKRIESQSKQYNLNPSSIFDDAGSAGGSNADPLGIR